MSWFKTGYESAAEGYDFGGKDGGPRRHWQPPETTNRVMFLDDDPFLFWEHNFQKNGHWRHWEVCLKRNKIEDSCAICDRYSDRYPYFIGLHTAINMTQWQSKKGNVYNYQREIFGAKLGGKDKPGILKKLERVKAKHGRLRGLVFDVYRSGQKTEGCGDEFELVEKIDSGDIKGYATEKLTAFLETVNANIGDPDKKMTVEKLMERNPWESYNFEEIIKPKSNSELRAEVGSASEESKDERKSSFSDSPSSDPLEDDIPY